MTTTCTGCIGCIGCIGRGTGTACCMCARPIPADLRRTPGGGPAYPGDQPRTGCADCRAGRPHSHR